MPDPISGSRSRGAVPVSSTSAQAPTAASQTPAQPAQSPAAQGWAPQAGAARARPAAPTPAPTMLPEGPLKIPLKLMVDGREVSATLTTTVKNRESVADLSSRGTPSGTPITVQDLSAVRVQVGGKKYALTDAALIAVLGQQGVRPDFPFSSRTEVSSAGIMGLGGSGKLVGLTPSGGFELRKSDREYFHSGMVSLAHPDRVY